MDSNGALGFNEQDYQLLSEKEKDQNKELDRKLDKVTEGLAGQERFYAVSADGSQHMLRGITSAVNNTVAIRTDRGTLIANAPTLANELTTKKYVDDIKTELLAAIQSLREKLSK